jgi:hypothetical protein
MDRRLEGCTGHGMFQLMGQIQTVALVLEVAALYGAVGFLFALAFLTVGVGRIDPGARGSGIGFRLTILPGVVALWPLMLVRWIVGGAPHGPHGGGASDDKGAH